MQIQNRQARVAALLRPGREKAATVGECQEIAYSCLIPAAIPNPFGEHTVEQVTATSRKQPRTHVALLRKLTFRREVPSTVQVAALIAETLQAEVIRHAGGLDPLQPLIQRGMFTAQLRQA